MRRLTDDTAARRLAALAVLVLLLLVSFVLSARAQAPDAEGANRTPLSKIGVCQCIAERASLDLRCLPSPQQCQAVCGSTHFAFVPIVKNALSECPPDELYIVLPNADGRPGSGAISVIRGGVATLLNSAYAAAELVAGTGASVAVGADDVKQVFGVAITARPLLPRHFRVFFASNSDRMTPESEAELRAAVADIKSRPPFQVEVVGDTDTSAAERANKSLSINRAQAVQRALVEAGVDAGAIAVSGRTDRDPLVATGPGVSESRNRRVEITVR